MLQNKYRASSRAKSAIAAFAIIAIDGEQKTGNFCFPNFNLYMKNKASVDNVSSEDRCKVHSSSKAKFAIVTFAKIAVDEAYLARMPR